MGEVNVMSLEEGRAGRGWWKARLSSLISSHQEMRSVSPPPVPSYNALLHLTTGTTRTETLSQSKPSLFLSSSISGFCHSSGKLTFTYQ